MPNPGTTFHRWTLAQPIAQGGAGVVWRAIEARTGTAVAVKLLPLDAGGAELAARESEVMLRVRHPGVVRVHATIEAHGHAAIVMDLAEGSLAELVHRAGPLPADAALDAAILASDALAAAHAAGVVHRDVKPHNLLWFQDAPHVRLSDFGIAHGAAHARTRTGALLGSIPFMAPEQRRDSRAVLPATDVYALAVTLAWLCLGEAPDDLFAPDAVARLQERGMPPAMARLVTGIGAWRAEDRPRDGAALRERLILCRDALGAGEGAFRRWITAHEQPGRGEVGAPWVAPTPSSSNLATATATPPARSGAWATSLWAISGVLIGGALVGGGAWLARPVAPDAVIAGAPAAPPSLPRCPDAIATWVDDVHMGPRESIEAAIDDLDEDGLPDVLINNNYSASVSVWWGQRGAMPADHLELPSGRSDTRPFVADLDDDGLRDLVVANNDDASFTVLRGLGARQFERLPSAFQSPGPRRPVVVDADGDGRANDLLFAQASEALTLSLRKGSGPWTFAPQSLLAPHRLPVALVRPAKGDPWVLLRGTDAPTWWRLVPGRLPTAFEPIDLPADTTQVLVARPPGASGDALHLVSPSGIVRVDEDGARCQLSGSLPATPPLALSDLDRDGTLDAVRIDTCARCESNHVFVRGLR